MRSKWPHKRLKHTQLMVSSRNFRRRDTAGEDSGGILPWSLLLLPVHQRWLSCHMSLPSWHSAQTHGNTWEWGQTAWTEPSKIRNYNGSVCCHTQGLFYYNKVIISWTATFSWFMRTFTLHKYSLHHWDSSCSKQTREAAYAFSKASTISIRRLVYKIGCQSAVCKLFHEPKGRAELPVAEVK